MSRKYALVIGNTEYNDTKFAQLKSPSKDAEDFANVLKSICEFDDVKTLLNNQEYVIREAIGDLLSNKKNDDLLILYFSGHGIKDEFGKLYLAVKNTNRFKLRATAVSSDYVREAMSESLSRRQVLILDCCNSGAFAQGTKAVTGGSMGISSALGGYGHITLTASDSTQYAWEGDRFIGEAPNSLFTHFLIKGLKSEADLDGDGQITVDELYDYAFEQVRLVTPKQTPSKFSSSQKGEIVLRQIKSVKEVKPISLPDYLIDEIEDTRPYVREVAVQKLEKILKGKNIGLARSAKEALEKIIEDENTTRRVADLAIQILNPIRQTEQKIKEEQKAREDNSLTQNQNKLLISQPVVNKTQTYNVPVQVIATSIQTHQTRWALAIWIGIGWAISWLIISIFFDFNSGSSETVRKYFTISGGISGFVTALILRKEKIIVNWKSIIFITLGWTLSLTTVGWSLIVADNLGRNSSINGNILSLIIFIVLSLGAIGIGGGITAVALKLEGFLSTWKSIFITTVGWIIGFPIGVLVGVLVGALLINLVSIILSQFSLITTATDDVLILAGIIGMTGGIMGLIGSFIMIWRIRAEKRN